MSKKAEAVYGTHIEHRIAGKTIEEVSIEFTDNGGGDIIVSLDGKDMMKFKLKNIDIAISVSKLIIKNM